MVRKITQLYSQHGVIFFPNPVSCVVSTQDDYFKSWAPAKSLDQGESCGLRPLLYSHQYLCLSVTKVEARSAADVVTCLFLFFFYFKHDSQANIVLAVFSDSI